MRMPSPRSIIVTAVVALVSVGIAYRVPKAREFLTGEKEGFFGSLFG